MGEKKHIWSIIRDVVISAGLDAALLAIIKKGMQTAVQKAGEEFDRRLEDRRAQLLDEIRLCEEDGHNMNNLWRRHEKSIKKLEENRFVTLLCKLCPDEKEGRKPALIWLNGISDKKFEQVLYFLDHDPFLQWAHKVRRRGGRLLKEDVIKLKGVLSGAEGVIRTTLRTVLIPGTTALADRLELLATERNS